MDIMDILSKPPDIRDCSNKQRPAPAIAPTRAW